MNVKKMTNVFDYSALHIWRLVDTHDPGHVTARGGGWLRLAVTVAQTHRA